MRRTIKTVIGGGITVVLTGSIGAGVLISREAATRVPAAKPAQVNTATVTQANLAQTETLPGTLGFGAQMTINGAGSGIITGLPAIGSVASRGQVLYRVDDQPVAVFYGSTPLFRTLAAPKAVTPTVTRAHAPTSVTTSPLMTGHDVTVVARNLAALGYDIGAESPAPNGEDSYTPALAAAVKAWQLRVGMNPTGTLGVGQVVVVSGPLGVVALSAQVGDADSGQLLTASATAKVVSVAVAATDLTSVAQGARVSIALPDGTSIPGTVTAIGQVVQSSTNADTGDSGTDTYNITVTPLHQAQVGNLQSAPVQVTFVTSAVRRALAVPVNALLALAGGGYALQLTSGTLIPVQTGVFASGMVQVTGTGVHAGLEVRSA